MTSDVPAWSAFDSAAPPALPDPGSPRGRIVVLVATDAAVQGGWAGSVAVQMAASWMASGRRLVLADAGFATPTLHEAAGVTDTEGLADLLLWGASVQRVARRSEAHGVFVVPAGTALANGAEAFRKPRWGALCAGFRDAGVTFAVLVPDGDPGLDAVLREASDVIVLSAEEEVAVGVDRVLEKVVARVGLPEGGEPADDEEPGDEPVLDIAELAPAEDGTDVEDLASPDDIIVDVEDLSPDEVAPREEPAAGPDEEVPGAEDVAADPADLPAADDPAANLDNLTFVGDDMAAGQEQAGAPVEEDDVAAGLEELTPAEEDFVRELEELAPVEDDLASGLEDLPPAEVDVPSEVEEGAPPDEDTGMVAEEPVPVPDALAPAPDEVAAELPAREDVPGPAAADQADSQPDLPGPPAPTFEQLVEEAEAVPQRSGGRRIVLLVILLAVLVAVVGAAWLGYVDIPGITPKSGGSPVSSVVEVPVAAAAEPVRETSPAQRYSVAVASYRDAGAADALARRMARGAPGVLFITVPVDVAGTLYYRVLAGPAPDSAAADELRLRVAREAGGDPSGWLVRPTPRAFLLAEAADEASAEGRLEALRGMEIPAYVLAEDYSDGSTRFRVYAGAYVDDAEASVLSGLLEAHGLTATLTQRTGRLP